MTFFVQGPSSQKLMPMVRLFGKYTIAKAQRVEGDHRVEDMGHYTGNSRSHVDSEKIAQSGIAVQYYHDIEQLPQSSPKLIASQIMTSSVITLKKNDSIANAWQIIKEKRLRHIPIVASDKTVEGILSDRNILHYLSGLNDDNSRRRLPTKSNQKVLHLMQTNVLTASADTDVRYIARLFVEQHIGAMPIVEDAHLIGIITRSDVLAAVMRHFILELWA